MQLMAYGIWWVMWRPLFLPSSCDHGNQRKELDLTVDSVFSLPSLLRQSCLVVTARMRASCIEKELPQIIVALQKSFLSFSHTGMPEEGKPEFACSDPWSPIIVSTFSIPMSGFVLKVTSLPKMADGALAFHGQGAGRKKDRGAQRIHPYWFRSHDNSFLELSHKSPLTVCPELGHIINHHWKGGLEIWHFRLMSWCS